MSVSGLLKPTDSDQNRRQLVSLCRAWNPVPPENDFSLVCTSLGNHGTSTSTRISTSALGTALSGTKPTKHGESCEILLVMLASYTAMPANLASASIASI
jgi:hypothetical protein